jgi:hypothetical protein
MQRNSTYINRIAQMVLADASSEWVSKQEYPRPPREWGSDVHETSLGWGRGKEVKPEPNQNVPHGTNQEVVPRWKKDSDFANRITKQRPDLDAGKVYEELKGYSDSKSRKLALHWTLTKGIVSPEEDKQKVLRAIKVSEMKKIDPMKYKSPLEITESFGHEVKEDRINPDTIKEFSNKKTLPEGVTYYDVENSKQGQLAARKILDSHFGKDSNPWCLLYKEQGSDTPSGEAWGHWRDTYSGDKKIAFQNGRLIAFYGGDQWWDRLDNSTNGIPITAKLPNDKIQRKALVQMDPKTGKIGNNPVKIFNGDPRNGKYEEWYTENKDENGDYIKSLECNRKNGVFVGIYKRWNKNGTLSQIAVKDYSGNGRNIGEYRAFHDNGKPMAIYNYDPNGSGEKVGESRTFHYSGSPNIVENYDPNGSGNLVGERVVYHPIATDYELYSNDGSGKLIDKKTVYKYPQGN